MNLNFLFEALKPSQYRNLVKNWDKTRYEEIFKAYAGDKKHYRIYIPIEGQVAKKVEPPADIKAAVEAAGFVIEDYVQGIAATPDGKRQMKIGKILGRSAPDLANKFANDKTRQASKAPEWLVVISRHPYDIAGMSTDRGWRSCMNLQDGINRHYVPIDIKEGTIVAYLVKNDDKNIGNPTARMLIKPFINMVDEKETAFGIENKIYGTPVEGFDKTVEKWVDEQNKKKKLMGMFVLNNKLYNDGGVNKFRAIGALDEDEKRLANEIIDYYPNIRDIENPSEFLQMTALHVGGARAFGYIKNPSNKTIEWVLKKDWHKVMSNTEVRNRLTDEQKMFAIEASEGSAIQFFAEPTEEMQIKAVSLHNHYALVKRTIRKEPSEAVQEAAVRHYGRALKDIGNPSEKIQDIAIESDGSLIEDIEKPTEKQMKLAARSYKYLLKHLTKKKIKPSEEVILESLKHFPAQIRHLEKAPLALLQHAMSHDGHAVEYILHMSHISPEVKNNLIMMALKQNGLAIKHIENPTKQQQVQAVKTTPEAVKLLKNPHPAAAKIAKEAGITNFKGWDKV